MITSTSSANSLTSFKSLCDTAREVLALPGVSTGKTQDIQLVNSLRSLLTRMSAALEKKNYKDSSTSQPNQITDPKQASDELIKAITQGDFDRANNVLDSNVDATGAGSQGSTPLHVLISSNSIMTSSDQVLLLKKLAQKGAVKEQDLVNLLKLAIKVDKPEFAKIFTKSIKNKGSIPNKLSLFTSLLVPSMKDLPTLFLNDEEFLNKLIAEKDDKGNNALHLVCSAYLDKGNLEIQNYLLEILGTLSKAGLDVNEVNKEQKSPMHIAIDGKNVELLNYLINTLSGNINHNSRDGSLLNYALKIPQIDDVFCVGIKKLGADLSLVDEYKMNASQLASKHRPGSTGLSRTLTPKQ